MTRRALPLGLLLVALVAGPGVLGGGRARAADPDVMRWEDLAGWAGARHDVPRGLILAEIQVESGGDPNAYSTAGAIGLAQIMPGWADNLFDPAVNLDTAARILRDCEDAAYGHWRPLPDPAGTWRLAEGCYLTGYPTDVPWYEDRVTAAWQQIAAAGG